jgi:hypothetical protein
MMGLFDALAAMPSDQRRAFISAVQQNPQAWADRSSQIFLENQASGRQYSDLGTPQQAQRRGVYRSAIEQMINPYQVPSFGEAMRNTYYTRGGAPIYGERALRNYMNLEGTDVDRQRRLQSLIDRGQLTPNMQSRSMYGGGMFGGMPQPQYQVYTPMGGYGYGQYAPGQSGGMFSPGPARPAVPPGMFDFAYNPGFTTPTSGIPINPNAGGGKLR